MPTWDDVLRIVLALPDTEESTSYGTPALKVSGKTFVRVRDARDGAIVAICSLEEKEALLQTDDPAIFTTSHYDGYGAVLIDLAAIPPASCATCWKRRGGRRHPRRSAHRNRRWKSSNSNRKRVSSLSVTMPPREMLRPGTGSARALIGHAFPFRSSLTEWKHSWAWFVPWGSPRWRPRRSS